MPEHPPTETSRRRDLALLAVAIVIALIIITVLVVRQHASDTSASAAGTSTATSAAVGAPAAAPLGPLGDLARRQPNDPMAQGSVTAPVTFIEFADFRCPFCAQFTRTTEPQLVDKYVNSGVLRIEWRDMPIFGEQSMAAARAGRAAAAQGRFWPFVNAVYQAAPPKATLTSPRQHFESSPNRPAFPTWHASPPTPRATPTTPRSTPTCRSPTVLAYPPRQRSPFTAHRYSERNRPRCSSL